MLNKLKEKKDQRGKGEMRKSFLLIGHTASSLGKEAMHTFPGCLPEFKCHSESLRHCKGYCLCLLWGDTHTHTHKGK